MIESLFEHFVDAIPLILAALVPVMAGAVIGWFSTTPKYVWSFWREFILGWVIGLFLGGLHWSVQPTLHKSITLFEIIDNERARSVLPASFFSEERTNLVELAGLRYPGQERNSVEQNILERITSQEYLAHGSLGLVQDPYFNPQSAGAEGLGSRGIDQELVWKEIRDSFSESMQVVQRPSGLFSLSVSHPNKDRSREIANAVVDKFANDLFEQARTETRQGLNYLAEELLEVRTDLDRAFGDLNDFLITNSTDPERRFLELTQSIETRREKLNTNEYILGILATLRNTRARVSANQVMDEYNKHLHMLGQQNAQLATQIDQNSSPEGISSVMKTVEVENQLLRVEIDELTWTSREYGSQTAEKKTLERELRLQEEIYTSVVQHFEKRSLAAGFEEATIRIVSSHYLGHDRSQFMLVYQMLISAFTGLLLCFAGVSVWLLCGGRRVETENQLLSLIKLERQKLPSGFISIRERSWWARVREIVRDQRVIATRNIAAAATEVSGDPAGSVYLVSDLHAGSNAEKFASYLACVDATDDQSNLVISVKLGRFDSGDQGSESSLLSEIIDRKSYEHCVLKLTPMVASSTDQMDIIKTTLSGFKQEYGRVIVVLPNLPSGLPLIRFVAGTAIKLFILTKIGRAKFDEAELVRDQLETNDVNVCWVAS